MSGCSARGYGRAGAGLLVALFVVASVRCGSPPEAKPTVPSGPEFGGTLRLVQEIPAGLDPVSAESVYESLPINQIFDTLVKTDASLNVVPSLAEAWRISRDGLTYEFEMRGDVEFHDGHLFDAGDVVFTLHRALSDGGPDGLAYGILEPIRGAAELAAGEADRLDGVTRIDDRTVRIELTAANPMFLEELATDNLAIVPEHVLISTDSAEFARSPVGTGPFAFVSWNDDHMMLRRNPDYFGSDPYLDAVRINFYAEGEDDYGLGRFTRGEIDALEPTTKSYASLLDNPGVDLHKFQELSLSFLGLNASRPPLDKTWVRQAIAHAIHDKRMVEQSPAVRVQAPGILPPGIAGYTPELKRLEYSPETARRILADAGHPEGQGLPTIELCEPTKGMKPDKVVRQVLADLEAVGLKVELQQMTWGEMGDRLDAGTCGSFLLAWIAGMSDPDTFLSGFGENTAGDIFMYRDERAVELLTEAGREFEPEARGRLYRKAERYILEQAPLVPLYHTRGMLATKEAVRGMRPGPFGVASLELERVWIKPEGIAR